MHGIQQHIPGPLWHRKNQAVNLLSFLAFRIRKGLFGLFSLFLYYAVWIIQVAQRVNLLGTNFLPNYYRTHFFHNLKAIFILFHPIQILYFTLNIKVFSSFLYSIILKNSPYIEQTLKSVHSPYPNKEKNYAYSPKSLINTMFFSYWPPNSLNHFRTKKP